MVKLNTLSSGRIGFPEETSQKMWQRPDAVANVEGGLAFKMDAYNELAMRTLSCMFGEPKFYQEIDEETGILQAVEPNSELLRLARSIAVEDPKFVLQLAAIARNDFYLRTVPVVLLTEVAILNGMKKIPAEKGAGNLIREYAPAILKRADEPGEALAYYIARNGSSIGNGGRYPQSAQKGVVLTRALRDGIEEAIFKNFDAYQISKYNRINAAVKWKDVISLVHPYPRSEDWSKIFKDVLSDELATAETWEDTLMNWKSKGFESKTKAWESIIPQMGYMALIRNLRNFIQEGISPTAMAIVRAKLIDPKQIKNSKQFPYRFYTAYKMIEQMSSTSHPQYEQQVQSALEDAMTTSLDNLPRWAGTTAVVADKSGSMAHKLSSNSVVQLNELSALFMVMSAKLCETSYCLMFSDYTTPVRVHERSGVLDNVQRLLETDVGPHGGTEAWTVMAHLINNKIKVDRMVFFSDMQCYNAADRDRVSRDEGEDGGWSYHGAQFAPLWNLYKRRVNPNAYLYTFNLADYGTSITPITTHNLFLGSGFSDKLLEFVPLFETNKTTLLEKIRTVNSESYYKKKRNDEPRGSPKDISPPVVVTDDTDTHEIVE